MTYSIDLRKEAESDILYFKKHDPKLLLRIKELIAAIVENPFAGIGKPEPLKYDLAQCWSRRINREHRLVYQVKGKKIIILQCRYHYDK